MQWWDEQIVNTFVVNQFGQKTLTQRLQVSCSQSEQVMFFQVSLIAPFFSSNKKQFEAYIQANDNDNDTRTE